MVTIDIVDSGISINKKLVKFPIKIDTLIEILGKPTWNKNMGRYIWNDLGIFVRAIDKINVELFSICLIEGEDKDDPNLPFNGKLTINGKDYKNTDFKIEYDTPLIHHLEKNLDFVYATASREKKNNKIIDITVYKQTNEDVLVEDVFTLDPQKYNLKKIKGKKIKFYDFNFKLAIIQELMYKKKVLYPEFDLNEFVELYKKRKIDINLEGDNIIPEIKEYFKKLEIGIELAEHVNKISQLENDIYMNIIPFWDGEDDVFNIKSIKGIEQFKNLKKATLFYDKDKTILGDFKKAGVEAKWL